MTVYSQKGSELVGLVLLSSALLLTLSLISHHALDPSFNVAAPAQGYHNWIGKAGAYLSDWLFQLLGLSAFLLPAPFLVAGYKQVRRRPLESPYLKILVFTVALLSVAAGLDLLDLGVPEPANFTPGGILGLLLAHQLLQWFNQVGALIVVATLTLLSLLVATRFSVDATLSWLGRRDWNLLARVRERWEWWAERRRDRKALAELKKDRRTVVAHPAPRRVVLEEPAPAEPSRPEQEPVLASPRQIPSEPVGERASRRALAPEGASPYRVPPLDFLQLPLDEPVFDEQELIERAQKLATKCAEFGVHGRVLQIHPGPVVTTFEFRPDPGVKYSRITTLSDDLCLALKAESVRIDRIPGKNTVGIEVPNLKRQTIYLREILGSAAYEQSSSRLTLALGQLINGNTFVTDLARMPHLLIAGSTGAGKSVALNCMICSIVYKAGPEDVRFIMVDPKRLELGLYEDIPHLLTPIVTDPKKAANALQWAVSEMEHRYKILAQLGVRNIDQYNRLLQAREREVDPEVHSHLPFIVIIVDELADLMITSGKEVETALTRLAQMARAVGIHLILATQRPSVDVLTGLIKANFPSRISFRVSSKVDSRTILDANGAEQLLGMGDMLFLSPGTSRLVRIHGAYISEKEIANITRFLKDQGVPEYREEVLQGQEESDTGLVDLSELEDDLYEEAARFVVETGKASTSLLQRRLRIGYGRAARLLDMMEHEGIVGPSEGSKPREVLVPADYFEERDRHLE